MDINGCSYFKFLLIICSHVYSSSNQLVDFKYQKGQGNAYKLSLSDSIEIMNYWAEKYNFDQDCYGFYSKESFFTSKSCPTRLPIMESLNYNKNDIHQLINDFQKNCIKRYIFLVDYTESHGFALAYLERQKNPFLVCFDNCASNMSFLSKLAEEYQLPVFLINKTLQNDLYSCYLMGCLIAKELLASNDKVVFRLKGVGEFCYDHASFNSDNNFYFLNKLPAELLKGCQAAEVFKALAIKDATIIRGNHTTIALEAFRKSHMVVGADIKNKLNNYLKNKGVFMVQVILPIMRYCAQHKDIDLAWLVTLVKESHMTHIYLKPRLLDTLIENYDGGSDE